MGTDALQSLSTGGDNTASGWKSLFSNTTGSANTANGDGAHYGNVTGVRNSGLGYLMKAALAQVLVGNGSVAMR
jgi:trimeric autotransporter adhesin